MTVQETEIVKEIRDKYLGKETTTQKINRLVSLDESVYRSGNIVALSIGIIGMLIFGTGMTCFIVWQINVLGIIIGIFGIQVMCLAMPIRNRVIGKKRKEVARDIQILSSELLGEN